MNVSSPMATVSVYVPDELKQEMESYDEINWSVVARKAIQKKIVLLKQLDEVTRNSSLSEDDIVRAIRRGRNKPRSR